MGRVGARSSEPGWAIESAPSHHPTPLAPLRYGEGRAPCRRQAHDETRRLRMTVGCAPTTIGSRITRLEDEPLLRGRGRFVDDIALPGVWHAAFVRSPHPHALIKGIDKSAALAVPGVHAVLDPRRSRHGDGRRAAWCGIPTPACRSTRRGRSRSPTARCPTSASRWRWCWRTTATSPRTPRRWSTVDYEPLPFVADVRHGEGSARRSAASSRATSSPPTRSRSATSTRPSPRPRMCSSRSCGSTAARRIRSRRAACSPSCARPTAASPCTPRRRRRTTCSRR